VESKIIEHSNSQCIFDWKDTLIKSSPDRVIVYLDCVLQNGWERTLIADGVIKQGVAIINVIIPENALT